MLQQLAELPETVVGLKAVGKVSKEDYQRTFEPLIDAARRDGRHLRLLYQFGPDFDGFTVGAAWEDARLGLHSLPLFEGCAIVSDSTPMRELAKLMGVLMACPVRAFPNVEYRQAAEWLAGLPAQGGRVCHHLIPDLGVMAIEINGVPSATDFEALALTADAWTAARGELHGLVIRAREFPGWENFQDFLKRVGFLRDHRREVRRIALATDSKLATWSPYLADHFGQAELKSFSYLELEHAIAWAAEKRA